MAPPEVVVIRQRREMATNGSVAVTLEFYADEGSSLRRVGELRVGALEMGPSSARETRRVRAWEHSHSSRGSCLAIEPTKYEYYELHDLSEATRRDLQGGSFARWAVPDRIELVDGIFRLPHAGEALPDGGVPSWTLTGLWHLKDDRALVRVDADPNAECPSSP